MSSRAAVGRFVSGNSSPPRFALKSLKTLPPLWLSLAEWSNIRAKGDRSGRLTRKLAPWEMKRDRTQRLKDPFTPSQFNFSWNCHTWTKTFDLMLCQLHWHTIYQTYMSMTACSIYYSLWAIVEPPLMKLFMSFGACLEASIHRTHVVDGCLSEAECVRRIAATCQLSAALASLMVRTQTETKSLKVQHPLRSFTAATS